MRRGGLSLLVVPALALAGACGSDTDPLGLVTAAGAETADDGVARLTMTTEVTVAGTSFTVAAEGVVDFDHDRAALTVEQQGVPPLETVADGTTVYLRSPQVAATLGVGTPWAAVDVARVGARSGTDLEVLRTSGTDAASDLDLLQGAAEVEVLGDEEVAGAETTHYRGTIDLREAVEQAGAVADRSAFEQFVDSLGVDDLPIDVWLDGEDRVRRLRYELPTTPEEGTSATVTLELSDFGIDEAVAVPSPGEVTDVTDRLLQEGRAGAS